MFDWARGSVLKKMIELEMFQTDRNWFPAFLKNWHTPWLLGLIEFTPRMCVLDVGSSDPKTMQHVHRTFGCEVHAMDTDRSTANRENFGFSAEMAEAYPDVTLHNGLAGEEILPPEKFDLITCISVLEHTYDRCSPLEPENSLAHLNPLRDMVRMLKPGGVLLMNWDMYLHGLDHHVGWDFEVDYQLLRACGMRLLTDRRRLRGIHYIFDHPDTLFFDHEQVLKFDQKRFMRGTAINMLLRKPGNMAQVRIQPLPKLESHYFPEDETTAISSRTAEEDLSTVEIDHRFRTLISRVTSF